jgi:hypothetical protein
MFTGKPRTYQPQRDLVKASAYVFDGVVRSEEYRPKVKDCYHQLQLLRRRETEKKRRRGETAEKIESVAWLQHYAHAQWDGCSTESCCSSARMRNGMAVLQRAARMRKGMAVLQRGLQRKLQVCKTLLETRKYFQICYARQIFNIYVSFLRSVRRLLVTANVVPSSPILVTLMKEALRSS